jgi:XTP/dITP diphosphohydrolase
MVSTKRKRLRLVLATTNPGKVREIRRILKDLPLSILTRDDFPDCPDVAEGGRTMLANALKKAAAVARHSGLPALADDSGLEIDHLGGAPGVRSARFSGPRATDERNIAKVLSLMDGVPPPERRARFRCVVAVVVPGQAPAVAEGICEGVLTTAPRGTRGFGYDPIFLVPRYGRTFGELGSGVKNRISHRAKALRKARGKLARTLGLLPEITDPNRGG